MKKNVLALAMLFCSLNISAQTENGFQEFDVLDNFKENPFTYFTHAPILAAGDKNKSNAMTIGWGGMGTIWGRNRPTITVYVAQKRYTHEFLEKSKYFTIMQFSDTKVIEYMGKYSGRDGDKAKALGLHVAFTNNGTPYYKEADAVIECEIMYGAPFDEKYFRNDIPKNMYANFPAGIHSMYMGEVVGAWIKEGSMSQKMQNNENQKSVKDVLGERQSCRSYQSKALTDNQLLDILWAANGVNEYDKRTAPSAMNRQDIDLYVCKPDGTWKYDAEGRKLVKVTEKDIRPMMIGQNEFVNEAPATVLLVSDQRKFGASKTTNDARNLNFGLMDAGIVSENLFLYCTSVGLGTVPCAPKLDAAKIQKALKLDAQQIPLMYHPVGYPKE